MRSHVTLQYATRCKQDPCISSKDFKIFWAAFETLLLVFSYPLTGNLIISAVICDGVVKDSNVINVLLFGVIHIRVIHSTGTCYHGNTAG